MQKLFLERFFGFGWIGYRLMIARSFHWISRKNECIYDAETIKILLCSILMVVVIRWLRFDLGEFPWWPFALAWTVLAAVGGVLSKRRYVDILDRPKGWVG